MKSKTILVTGGSSGIGLSVCKILADKCHTVYEISRRDNNTPGIKHYSADVTDIKQLKLVIEEIIKESGTIDICINCAGFGISGASEFIDTNLASRQFDVNFFGTVNVNKCVIPYMRKNGKGRIINISSVAALAPIPFQSFYSASKAAINNYSLALDNELKPFDIRVCAIMPGDISTGFTDAREKSIIGDDIYNGRIEKSVKIMEKDERNGMSAEKAANYIVKKALCKNIKPLYSIGLSYKIISVLLKFLPVRFSNWVIMKLYA